MHKEKASIHGAVILVLAFSFFPLAYLLVLVRFSRHKHKSYMKARDYKVAGFAVLLSIPMITQFLAVTTSDVEHPSNDAPAAPFLIIFAIIFAIVLLILSRTNRLKIERILEKYKQLIIVQRVTSIDQISQAVGVSSEKALNDLQYMAQSGLLPFTYIDRENRQVIVQHIQEPWGNPPFPPQQNGPWNGPPPPNGQWTITSQNGQRTTTIQTQTSGGQWGGPSAPTGNSGGAPGASPSPSPQTPVSVNCPGCGAASTILPGETKYCEFCGNVLPRSG